MATIEAFMERQVPDLNQVPFKEGDMVWSHLASYPFWPSIVCSDPDFNSYKRISNNGFSIMIHVMFLDKPKPTRAWIDKGKVRPYQAYREAHCREKRIKSVLEEADQKAAQTNEERTAYANTEIEKMRTYPKEIINSDASLNASFPGASKPKAGRGSRGRTHDAGAAASSQPQEAEDDATNEDPDADMPLSQLSASATSSAVESAARTQESPAGADNANAAVPKAPKKARRKRVRATSGSESEAANGSETPRTRSTKNSRRRTVASGDSGFAQAEAIGLALSISSSELSSSSDSEHAADPDFDRSQRKQPKWSSSRGSSDLTIKIAKRSSPTLLKSAKNADTADNSSTSGPAAPLAEPASTVTECSEQPTSNTDNDPTATATNADCSPPAADSSDTNKPANAESHKPEHNAESVKKKKPKEVVSNMPAPKTSHTSNSSKDGQKKPSDKSSNSKPTPTKPVKKPAADGNIASFLMRNNSALARIPKVTDKPSTDGSAPASSTTPANAVAKDGVKSANASQSGHSKPPPPGSQNQNQSASTKPSASRPAQPGAPKPSASVRPSPASGQTGQGGSATARPAPARPSQQAVDVKQRQSGSGSVLEPVTVDDDADSPKEQPLESSALNESFSTALQAEAAAFASEPLDESKFAHSGYEFLQKDKLRDKNARCPEHPEYDARTLYVPKPFLDKQTPGLRQWWELKRDYFDTVLFFKMGKFYEMYHLDAMVCVRELGLTMMRGDVAHCGFPEVCVGRMTETLTSRGYKVARVEQTQLPSDKGQGSKVVRRELCRITTPATRTYAFLEVEPPAASSSLPSQNLFALSERIGQFTDDRYRTKLCTLLAQVSPVEVLLERGRVSPMSSSVLAQCASVVSRELLRPGDEFWSAKKTLINLNDSYYFKPPAAAASASTSARAEWPPVLKRMLSSSDPLGLTADSNCELAVSALGAITFYLQRNLVDVELLSMKRFEEVKTLYDLQVSNFPRQASASSLQALRYMVLDGITLQNLDVLECSSGTFGDRREGSLLGLVDRCVTPFGRRLLRQWLCMPLLHPDSIRERQEAIAEVTQLLDMEFAGLELPSGKPSRGAQTLSLRRFLQHLPDLERLLCRLHIWGVTVRDNKGKVVERADERAVIFGKMEFNKQKVMDFLSLIDGLKALDKLAEAITRFVNSCRSSLLKRLFLRQGDGGIGQFPFISEKIGEVEKAFLRKKAEVDFQILPTAGFCTEYDEPVARVKQVEREFDDYLIEQRAQLRTQRLRYVKISTKRYRIEAPDDVNVPPSFKLSSRKKGFVTYTTERVEALLDELVHAESERDTAANNVARSIFARFDESYSQWIASVRSVATLDALMSLASYSASCGGCTPQFVDALRASSPEAPAGPVLRIRNGRHPCTRIDNFVPNDTELENGRLILLITGPNMGGKTTYIRQVGLIVILAHLGCNVPADECVLSPVDRIFTRLGASDRILCGESTFLVELKETSLALSQGSEHSLVLLDELGRGTSTYDGLAIAYAVVDALRKAVRARTLFATHYHLLVDQLTSDQKREQTSAADAATAAAAAATDTAATEQQHTAPANDIEMRDPSAAAATALSTLPLPQQSSRWLSIAVGHMSYVAASDEENSDSSSKAEVMPKDEHADANAVDGVSSSAEPSANATRPKPQPGRVSNQRVTLLYRLVDGACPHSFGFNAARLAGLPEQVVQTGFLKARELERLELVKQIRSKLRAIKLTSDKDKLSSGK